MNPSKIDPLIASLLTYYNSQPLKVNIMSTKPTAAQIRDAASILEGLTSGPEWTFMTNTAFFKTAEQMREIADRRDAEAKKKAAEEAAKLAEAKKPKVAHVTNYAGERHQYYIAIPGEVNRVLAVSVDDKIPGRYDAQVLTGKPAGWGRVLN